MPSNISDEPRPRSGRPPAAIKRYGISRARLYELAPQYPGLLKKNGTATIVDYDVGDRIIDELPFAEIKPPKRTSKQQSGEVTT
jgi:hypothetical protein